MWIFILALSLAASTIVDAVPGVLPLLGCRKIKVWYGECAGLMVRENDYSWANGGGRFLQLQSDGIQRCCADNLCSTVLSEARDLASCALEGFLCETLTLDGEGACGGIFSRTSRFEWARDDQKVVIDETGDAWQPSCAGQPVQSYLCSANPNVNQALTYGYNILPDGSSLYIAGSEADYALSDHARGFSVYVTPEGDPDKLHEVWMLEGPFGEPSSAALIGGITYTTVGPLYLIINDVDDVTFKFRVRPSDCAGDALEAVKVSFTLHRVGVTTYDNNDRVWAYRGSGVWDLKNPRINYPAEFLNGKDYVCFAHLRDITVPDYVRNVRVSGRNNRLVRLRYESKLSDSSDVLNETYNYSVFCFTNKNKWFTINGKNVLRTGQGTWYYYDRAPAKNGRNHHKDFSGVAIGQVVGASGTQGIQMGIQSASRWHINIRLREVDCGTYGHAAEPINGFNFAIGDSRSVIVTTPFPTTTSTPAPPARPACSGENIKLEFFYIFERSLSYCGENTCIYNPSWGEERLIKKQSIVDRFLPMWDRITPQLSSVKLGSAEFIDKPVKTFGQAGVDFCTKFISSMTPYDAQYKAWATDHFERAWLDSGSGGDAIENQLDVMIKGAVYGDFSEVEVDEDGKLVVKILFILTDKAFHTAGDYPEGAEYNLDTNIIANNENVECQCTDTDYPTPYQLVDALVAKSINPIVMLGDDSPYALNVYNALAQTVKETDASLVAQTALLADDRFLNPLYPFNPALVIAGMNNVISEKCKQHNFVVTESDVIELTY